MQLTRPPLHNPLQTWDIFCRVIDNYGDAGVCWRLARQLAKAHGRTVRLWIDDLGTLQALCPALLPDMPRQAHAGIEICHWPENFPDTAPADVVIEAFACHLPQRYLHAMAARRAPPRWLNLEYLSAEAWVADCHGLASPHPSLPLTKYFFFPGFTAATGGLLRESAVPPDIPTSAPHTSDACNTLNLFCYAHAPAPALLEALRDSPQNWQINVSPGQAREALGMQFSTPPGGNGPRQPGNIRIGTLPFLTPDAYDAQLRQGTLNIVRGEDSFVRAQLAGRPFLWHIYPQEGNAHLDKLNAFLDLYTALLSPRLAQTVREMFLAWNTPLSPEHLAACWQNFHPALPLLAEHARNWQTHCQQLPELSKALIDFCRKLPP